MKSDDAKTFMGRLSVTYRTPFKEEKTGWLEWLSEGYVELDLATETLQDIKTTEDLPRLPAFKALYSELHRLRKQRKLFNRQFPDCILCDRQGTINYVRGGFTATITRPIHKDRPKNFPYLTDSQYTFCSCAKGKALFLEARPDSDWQKHVDFVFQVALGGNMAVTGRFMDACRKLPPEDWETWKGVLGSFKDLPLADTAGAAAEDELMDIPL